MVSSITTGKNGPPHSRTKFTHRNNSTVVPSARPHPSATDLAKQVLATLADNLLPRHRPAHAAHPGQLFFRHRAALQGFQRSIHLRSIARPGEAHIHFRAAEDVAV